MTQGVLDMVKAGDGKSATQESVNENGQERAYLIQMTIIYYCGQESHRRNGVALTVNKTTRNTVRGCNLKNNRMISVRFQGKPCNITVIQVYALTSNAEGAEVGQCHEDLLGFPDSSIGKESACNAGDPSLIPGLGRSAGEGIGYLLQYSWASLVGQLVKNPPAVQET